MLDRFITEQIAIRIDLSNKVSALCFFALDRGSFFALFHNLPAAPTDEQGLFLFNRQEEPQEVSMQRESADVLGKGGKAEIAPRIWPEPVSRTALPLWWTDPKRAGAQSHIY